MRSIEMMDFKFKKSIMSFIRKGEDMMDKKDITVIKTTLIISKKPGNTGISRDIRTEFTTDLLLSD